MNDYIYVIPSTSCHTSSDTILEYPRPTWDSLVTIKKIAIFGHYGDKNGLKKPKIAKTNQRSYLYLFLPL